MQTYIGEIQLHDIHNPAKTQRRMQDIMRDLGVMPILHASQAANQSNYEENNE